MRRFIRHIKNSYSDSGQIFEELLLALYAFALRLERNQHAAEDLVQEAALRAFRNFSQLRERSRFKNWMFQILRNVFLRRQPQQENIRESLEELSEDELAEDGETLQIERILNQEVRAALDRLPLDYRTTLWLFDLEGFSQQEISDILGCPIGTVGSRLYRARLMLRRTLLGRAREGKSRGERR